MTVQSEKGRSRKGAWIERTPALMLLAMLPVAPARERGLKVLSSTCTGRRLRRSRKGAWIERTVANQRNIYNYRRSRKGAWIERPTCSRPLTDGLVAPARERGLKDRQDKT